MLHSDILAIRSEIMETLLDFGTDEKETNIIWKKIIPSEYDVLFKQDVSKSFIDYAIRGVYINPRKNMDLTIQGYDPLLGAGLIISKEEFDAIEIAPKASDWVEVEGIVFSISKLNYIKLAGQQLFFMVYLKEAELSAQSEERIKEEEPYYPIEEGTNTQFTVSYPAIAMGTIEEFFYIDTTNNILSLAINTLATVTLAVDEDTYSAHELANNIQVKINSSGLGTLNLYATSDVGFVGLRTVRAGILASLTIISIANSIYDTIGIAVGTTIGSIVTLNTLSYGTIITVDLLDDPHYDNGSPV
jgi:hypothetical protein